MEVFVSSLCGMRRSRKSLNTWARADNDGMKASTGKPLRVHPRPAFADMTGYPNYQVSFLEANSQSSTQTG